MLGAVDISEITEGAGELGPRSDGGVEMRKLGGSVLKGYCPVFLNHCSKGFLSSGNNNVLRGNTLANMSYDGRICPVIRASAR